MGNKLKCPVCKGTKFGRVDAVCTSEYVYLEGRFMRMYRCNKCKIIIGEEA